MPHKTEDVNTRVSILMVHLSASVEVASIFPVMDHCVLVCSLPYYREYHPFMCVCVDIDECSMGSHDCEQVCTNTEGSFICSCSSGFDLSSNGRTCNGL